MRSWAAPLLRKRLSETRDARRWRRCPSRTALPWAAYASQLLLAPLAPASRGKYVSWVRGYLGWLARSGAAGDPLGDPAARDWAVRDYRRHLKVVRKSAPTTINNTLAAIDDFYTRRGLGPAAAHREDPHRVSPPEHSAPSRPGASWWSSRNPRCATG